MKINRLSRPSTLNPFSQLAALSVVLLMTACNAHSPASIQHSAQNPLLGMGEVEIVASGFISTEGPVWHERAKALLFSDIPGNTIYSLDTNTREVTTVRTPSSTPNGLALDNDGYLLIAEQDSRTISRMNLDTREVKPFITHFNDLGQSRAFNSPNDMAIHPNGGVYFTDPPFGLRGRASELDFNGVFLHSTGGDIQLLKQFPMDEKPNGIVFSPDYSVLYLAISSDDNGPILAFDVSKNGQISHPREFALAQNADGMAIDADGNLYVATRTGVRVWSASGHEWGWIRLPENIRTTNVAFGGRDMNTLFISNRSKSLYAVKLKHGL